MTQMCCDTTAREAAHRGFKVLMAADAMAAMAVKGPDGSSSRTTRCTGRTSAA